MICRRLNLTVFLYIKFVVIFASKQLRRAEARAEFHALHRRNTEISEGKAAFDTVKNRRSDARRHAIHGSLHHASHRISVQTGRFDNGAHAFLRSIVDDRKILLPRRKKLLRRQLCCVEGCIFLVFHRFQMRADIDSPLLQILYAQSAGKDQRRRQPRGKVAAAPYIIMAAISEISRIIRMSRSCRRRHILVVLRPLIRILNHRSDRRTAGDVVHHA